MIILVKGVILNFLYALPLLFISMVSLAQEHAKFLVAPGLLHSKGKVMIEVLPDPIKYRVQINFDVKKKSLVPIPSKFLKGKTVYEFPPEFRTEEGYKLLEVQKKIDIPKAVIRFVKRADYRGLKAAYFIEVLPTNKKSKIDIVYHPSLPATGWLRVEIVLLSKIPVVDGYRLVANLAK